MARRQGMSGASGEVMAAARSSRSRTPRGRAPRYASVTDFRAKLCGEGVVVERAGNGPGTPKPFVQCAQLRWVGFPSSPFWGARQEVVPARVTEMCQESEGTFR